VGGRKLYLVGTSRFPALRDCSLRKDREVAEGRKQGEGGEGREESTVVGA